MARRVLRTLRGLPPGVAASLAVHAGLVVGLFFLPGVILPAPETRSASLVRVDPAPRPELAPVPPPVEPPPPTAAEPVFEPSIRETPLEEPDPFDPDPPTAAAFPDIRTDLTPAKNRRTIGIGGGAPVRERARPEGAPPPASPLPAPPPPPPVPAAAVPIRTPLPDYPDRAIRREWEGIVTLLVEVREDGSVGEVTVKESSGHELLDRAAVAGVRRWEFRPATVRGRPARSWVEVPVKFDLP
jgi:protein TonB